MLSHSLHNVHMWTGTSGVGTIDSLHGWMLQLHAPTQSILFEGKKKEAKVTADGIVNAANDRFWTKVQNFSTVSKNTEIFN